jgi:hypothetical protein
VAVADIGPDARTRASALNPLAIRGTALPAGVLLAAKLVAFSFLANGEFLRLPEPFLPFIRIPVNLVRPDVFQHALQAVWLVAAAGLFMNRVVRLACGALAGTIFLAELASHVYRANNLTFTALLLVLIALSDRTTVSTVIRAQLVVLYFWAGLNKLLDEHWRSGAFFEAFSSLQTYGAAYRGLESLLPAGALSVVMSWVVIATELLLAVAFAVRRLVPAGVLILVAYHSSLLLVVGSTFNMFWFALLAACIALTDWPAQSPIVEYGIGGPFGRLTGVLRRLDIGRAFTWHPGEGSGLRLLVAERVFSGRDAFARLLFFHPTLYFIYFGIVAVPQPLRRWSSLVALGVVAYVAVEGLRTRLRAQLPVRA